MPKATVNKHDLSTARQYNVGRAGQVLAVQPEPIIHGVEKAPHAKFGRRVAPSHGQHAEADLWHYLRPAEPDLPGPWGSRIDELGTSHRGLLGPHDHPHENPMLVAELLAVPAQLFKVTIVRLGVVRLL